jgi:hypothetical protein
MFELFSRPAVFITILTSIIIANSTVSGMNPEEKPVLSRTAASNFTRIALRCIQKEYPNKPDHVMSDSSEVKTPRSLHPAFYGCYDWHSSVHGHWMLVRILHLFPDIPEANQIRTVLNENLSAPNVKMELTYLEQPNRKSFERTYGWAWLLKLAQELYEWNDPDARRWSKNLEPLTHAIAAKYIDFLPRQNYPIRTGVHPNTAFGLSFALDYSRSVHDTLLESLSIKRSIAYFKFDRACPLTWEPGGEDFFSPCLIEADLMRRVLGREEFGKWMKEFGQEFYSTTELSILTPAVVTDRTDPKLVHLDGLNLSRAWCMLGIASSLPRSDNLRNKLIASATKHAKAGLSSVTSGTYEGEHWLATFAVLMLDSFSQLELR